jgi:hypothetical protein
MVCLIRGASIPILFGAGIANGKIGVHNRTFEMMGNVQITKD